MLPVIEITTPYIPDALRHLGSDIDSIFEPALDEIAKGTVRAYQSQITAVGAIDTGDFINTVEVKESGNRYRVIASGVGYSGIVEHGWIYRARGQASYPGRWPAGRAIGMLGPIIEDAFIHQLWR